MKKIVAIMLGLVLMLSMVVCFAEEESFYSGTYHVGKDFRAGSYNIHVKKTTDDQPWAFINIYKDELTYSKEEPMIVNNFSEEGYHLYVTDGMVFNLVVFDCTLSIVNEKPSWMISNN